jgi:xanthine dehydrogenase YagR molybdenum-binding subunit
MAKKLVRSVWDFENEWVETVAEVPERLPEPWAPDRPLRVAGQKYPRVDGYQRVSGDARYAFDIQLPRMLHGKILRSPLPHARVKQIRAEKALALPGVVAVFTHENIPPIPWYGDSFLFDPHVRYEGDEVALVVAESEAVAEEALGLIEVDYEPLPFVIDPEEALAAGAPKLHDEGNLWNGRPNVYERGDVEKGFQEADVVVEDTFRTQVVHHAQLEVHVCVADWEGDQLTVYETTQATFSVQRSLASILKLPLNKVRVVNYFMGGGFGSKLGLEKQTVLAALAAKQLGRPVRIANPRKDEFLAMGNRPSSIQKLKVGAKRDGTLTAISLWSLGPGGAYRSAGAELGTPVREIYKCPNVRTEESTVYINAGPARPKRAPGHPQGTFALESILDEVAEKLGMDPLEFRLKNYAEIDQVRNRPYTSKYLREAYEAGAKAIGWYEKRNKIPGSGVGPIKRGIGMATQIWGGGGGPPAYATVEIVSDGSVIVRSGSQDIGGGTRTIVAQVAAEELGIPMDRVTVIMGDTALCPYGPTSGGSVTAASITPAVLAAAVEAREQLKGYAASALNVPADQLAWEPGRFFLKSDPGKSISFEEAASRLRSNMIVVTGARGPNPEGYTINSFGAQFAEVEVDTETGRVRVLKIVAAHSVGRLINPLTGRCQFEGGIIMGLGFALLENRWMDPNVGRMINTNLHDYRVPTMMEIPEIEVIIVSEPDTKANPVGGIGIGEPAIIPTAAAIANAVYNAIGVRVRELPITPYRVLEALGKA